MKRTKNLFFGAQNREKRGFSGSQKTKGFFKESKAFRAKIIVFAVLLAIMPIVFAQNPPSITFHQFYGEISGNANNYNVKAVVGTTGFTAPIANDRYGYSPLLLVDGGNNGDTVYFYINNMNVANYTPFAQGGVTKLDLRYTGPPAPTPTCSDNIQNQGETGVDCGGPCTACPTVTPTCSDNIQNQGETGVDCGGPCTACTTYPPATPGTPGTTGDGGGRSYRPGLVVDTESGECMDDWICTGWSECAPEGLQYRTCSLNDYPECTLIMEKPAEEQGCTPAYVPSASCFDGIQNQGETGVDCGGPCVLCPTEKINWLVPVIIILLATAVALAFLVYYVKFMRKPNVLSPLKKYVKDAKGKGFKGPRIRRVLRTQGWAKADIDKAMK